MSGQTDTSSSTGSRGAVRLELPPESAAGQAAPGEQASELGAGRRSVLGGYGEANLLFHGDSSEATLRRFVLFVGHKFNDWAAVYSETEIEDGHELELEQAYVELNPHPKLGVRAGLLLVPVGLVNLHHEPPTFHGVERPLVEQLIIPSTWRELGAGVFGELFDGLRWEAYLMTGLDASRLGADGGLAPARQLGIEAKAKDPAFAGRLSYSPTLGLELGLGGYIGGAGQDTKELGGVRVGVVAGDARYVRSGLELKAEVAAGFVSRADEVTRVLRASSPTALAVPSMLYGGYVEAAYDVFHGHLDQQLLPFVRFERFDTRAKLPDVLNAGESAPRNVLFLGLSYRPIDQLVFKFDYRIFLGDEDEEGEGAPAGEEAETEASNGPSFGVGFMF